jgi:hypothetical protein
MQTIKAQLIKLNAAYPRSKAADELDAIAEVWAEDFTGLSDGAFCRAVAQVRRGVRYFPTVADIMAAHRDIVARPVSDWKAIPQKPLTKPETAKRHIANLRAMAHDEPMPFVDEALDANPEAFEHYHARISR